MRIDQPLAKASAKKPVFGSTPLELVNLSIEVNYMIFLRPFLLTTLVITFFVSACGAKSGYLTTQTWQRAECRKLRGDEQRSRCLNNTTMTYEAYKREADDVTTGK